VQKKTKQNKKPRLKSATLIALPKGDEPPQRARTETRTKQNEPAWKHLLPVDAKTGTTGAKVGQQREAAANTKQKGT
jgi:hypothetical protein